MATTPDAIAVDDGRRQLSYRQLDRYADAIAARLREHLSGADCRVGVLAHRSVEAIGAFLGILKAGAAFVPLEASFPLQRLQMMLADTDACAVLAQPPLEELARKASDLPLISLEPELEPLAAGTAQPPPQPSSLAYVMYTSGTSGVPKGVAIEHRNVLQLVCGAEGLLPGAGDGVLHISQISFDASTYEIWGALCNGARVCVYRPLRPEPGRVRSAVEELGVTIAMLSAGILQQMVEAEVHCLASLRLVWSVGDVFSPQAARSLIEALPELRVVNGYGPTETTVVSTCFELKGGSIGDTVPIGHAIGSAELFVLDADLQPVAPGEQGELFIGGGGVARGYLNAEELNAEKFLALALHPGSAQRVYRTGDIVRQLEGGEVEFLGRNDSQFKIRGYRVELSEITAVLNRHPAIRAAEVVVREEVAGHKRMVCYVVVQRSFDTGQVRRYLQLHLPEYMMPSAFVLLESMPLTANGKIDREALPRHSGSGESPAPESPAELAVASQWQEVLGVDEVGVGDDFFEAGGDSLLALQLLSKIRELTGVELSLDVVFEGRTLASIAARVEAGLKDAAEKGVSGVAVGSLSVELRSGDRVTASMNQEQACFLTDLADESLPYQAQAILSFEGHLDRAALHRALQGIVDRHEILRTTFPKVDGRYWQQVAPHFEVELPVVDLRGVADQDQALAAVIGEQTGRRIELDRLPLIRWTLAVLADDRHALVQVEHHVIHDGWSFSLMLGEMRALYEAEVEGRPNPLPPLEYQYADFARWQRDFLDSAAAREQLDYWAQRLAGAPEAPFLPGDREAPTAPSFRGRSLRWDLPSDLDEQIHEIARRLGCTPYIVMLGAFVAMLSRLSGEGDVAVGSGLANRRVRGCDELIGMFVNTVAMRFEVDAAMTVKDLLREVREVSLGALAHQELPFEEVVKGLDPHRRAGRNPFYNHLFSFHDAPLPDLAMDEVRVDPRDVLSNGSAKADLNVMAINRRTIIGQGDQASGSSLSVVWEYSTDLYDASTAQQLFSVYQQLLEEMVQGADRLVTTLHLVSDEVAGELISRERWSSPYEREATIPELFGRAVEDRPDATAVVFGPEQMTYGELDQASDAVSDQLRRCGAAAGDVIAVVDERCLALPSLLLGVLKAGAAYLGVDPGLPESRIRSILGDAGVSLAIKAPGSSARLPGVSVLELAPGSARVEGATPTDEADRPRTTATELAYLSFTSGSTGHPKGVEVTHRGVVRLVRGANYLQLGPDARVLAAAPISFDASTFEIWAPLLNGGSVVIAPPGPLATAELSEIIAAEAVTTAWFTAGVFHQMVDHQLDAIASLRHVLAGGDVLSPPHVNQLLRSPRFDGILLNGYGPTENTTFTCCHRMLPGERIEGSVPIGLPISNTSVVIVDENSCPVPDGVPGELWIGGDGLARGYAGDAALTSLRFVPSPFGDALGDRLYRSGDRVRRRSDGVIEFLGRIDREVKIRGFRVDPTEVESALLELEPVAQAFVRALLQSGDDKRLVAYLVARSGAGIDPQDGAALAQGGALDDRELRRLLAERLPRYLIPSSFVWLEELPLTANGKIDARRLPVPASAWFLADEEGQVTPSSNLERPLRRASRLEGTLVSIWQEVIGVRTIGIHDDFFDLGGHSLLAVELFAAIERTIGARLPLGTIFEAPTISQMAAILRSDGWSGSTDSLVPLTKSGSLPPIFAVTAGDGNVVGFGPLAKRLGRDQPFYVLQPFAMYSARPLRRTVESTARHYVSRIRAVQPHGPYALLGRCHGSLVAYEMARQLEAAGEEVGFLGVIDSPGPISRDRFLANGLAFDTHMALALEDADADFGDVFSSREAAELLTSWLLKPASEDRGVAVSRYLWAAYQLRPDVQAAFPLSQKGQEINTHEALNRWAGSYGPVEMGLQERLLPTSEQAPDAHTKASRGRSRGERAKARLLDWLNFITLGKIWPLASNRVEEIRRIAYDNVADYRAGPIAAPVTLLLSEQPASLELKIQIARWRGLETGGVTRQMVRGSHENVLREPTVAMLAEALRDDLRLLSSEQAPETTGSG